MESEAEINWSELSKQINKEEFQGTLQDALLEIRRQINEAFDLLQDEELDEDMSDGLYANLDTALEEIEFAIYQLSQD